MFLKFRIVWTKCVGQTKVDINLFSFGCSANECVDISNCSSLMLVFHKSGMLPSWVVVKLLFQRSSPRAAVKKGYPTWQPENFRL